MAFSVAITEEGEQNDEFNFHTWIIKNELEIVKDLLIKHNATSPNTLTTNAPEFQKFMSDKELFSKSHMIPKILSAIHNIETPPSLIKIIVYQQEQEVIDQINENIKLLHKTQKQIEQLKKTYPKTIENIINQKTEKINATKIKINKIFDDLSELLNARKKQILHEIDAINVNNEFLNDNDEKEYESIKQAVATTNTFLEEQQRIYNVLTSTNENRLERKSKIIKMGQNVDVKFKQTQNILNKYIKTVTKKIEINNKYIVDIDFVVKENERRKIINCVNKLGYIIDKTGQYEEKNIDIEVEKDENEEDTIQKLKQEYLALQEKFQQEKTNRIKEFNQNAKVIKDLQGKLKKLSEVVLSWTTFTNNDKYRWMQSEQDDEKQSNISRCVMVIKQDPLTIQFKNGF
eukprot:19801_1